jgi:hypothetical protein
MCTGVIQMYRGAGVLIGNRSSTGLQEIYWVVEI